MGFIMEPKGTAHIETRRVSFILRVDGAVGWDDGQGVYGCIEANYEDIPSIFAALQAMCEQEHLPWPPEPLTA